MANSCYNFITIIGNKREIQDFHSLMVPNNVHPDDNIVFDNLISEFGKFQEDSKHFDIEINDVEEETITLSGDSAWSPCLHLFSEISKRFKSFEIRYEYSEMGADFSGWADISEGAIEDNCFAYWKGMIEINGEEEALQDVLNNELDSYNTFDDLMESDMFNAFSENSKNTILENFVEI